MSHFALLVDDIPDQTPFFVQLGMAVDFRAGQFRAGQIGSRQIRPFQVGSTEVGLFEFRLAQVSTG